MADLVDLSEVREHLQKPDPDHEQDAILRSLISRASETITRYTRREFTPTEDATREFVWIAGHEIDLAPYDLRSVTTLTLDSDLPVASQTVLTTSQYRLRPKPAPHGVYQRIELVNTWPPRIGGEVKVEGDWGFLEVPNDVKHACLVTLATWFRADVAAFTTRFNPELEQLEIPQAVPAGVLAALAPYRRGVVA
jgi:hypothetical protein